MDTPANAQPSVDLLTVNRNAYIDQFRKTGNYNHQLYERIIQDINKVITNSSGESRARILFELATMNRMGNNHEVAIRNYQECIAAAKKLNQNEIIFDAYIGIARSHVYGTRKHGAAANAFEQAIKYAGNNPSSKQLYEMADYASQLQTSRGELESALINALKAVDLASNDSELFYAQLDAGDALQKFAESCDYRKILDAKSMDDGEDTYGACKRAVYSANEYYVMAKKTAQKLGWNFLERETDGFIQRLSIRLQMIESKASFEKMGITSIFNAVDVRDVLVNEEFLAGASELSEFSPLGILINEVVADKETQNPRDLYLLGLKADIDNDPVGALNYFNKAVTSLYKERSGFFDLRHQGTVVENRRELVRDLGLRLLSFGGFDDAFLAFESIRAYGLSTLMNVFANAGFSDDERKVMADLIQLESQKSALQTDLVYSTIAGIEFSKSSEILKTLDEKERRIRKLSTVQEFHPLIEKITAVIPELVELRDLKNAVKKANIPVIFYWVTSTNVVVWVVSPAGMEVKTVFLPEVAVQDKVEKLRESIGSEQPYDDISASELYTYLIAPFKHLLLADQVIICPQGALVSLPFEALKNNNTGKYLAEEMAVSYAPNGTFALNRLQDSFPRFSDIKAIYDEELENINKEVARIGEIPDLQVNRLSSAKLDKAKMFEHFSQAEFVHVLLHGQFNVDDPLQSILKINNNVKLTAADLININWKNVKLAVFSSCEGGRVKTRISNELFGFSWVLIAGGVDNIVLSRWLVQSDKNSDWMKTFYKAMAAEGLSPALAANQAMCEMIKKDNNPYYWSGPQVYGK